MALSDRQLKLQANATAALQELSQASLEKPLQVSEGFILHSLDKFVSAAQNDLSRLIPGSPLWRAVYLRIYNVREAIRKENANS